MMISSGAGVLRAGTSGGTPGVLGLYILKAILLLWMFILF